MRSKACTCECGERDPAKFYAGVKSRCRECYKRRRRERYTADPARELTRNAAYAAANPDAVQRAQDARRERERQRPKRARTTPEQTRARRRRWKRANAARLRAQDRARYRRDRDKARQKDRRRRALRHIGRDPSAVAYADALRRDPCAYCGEAGGALDHIDAAHTGGAHHWANLTGACRPCNSRKHTKPLLLALLASERVPAD